ncbi:MAG TPA: hypothetical protein VFE27_25040, partial [Acidobacteriaceae bacterium]|nr:hypothetical protein [Acidobacteriaceae bacterium]
MSSIMQRRDFLKISGAITALSLTHRALAGPSERIFIIVDGGDPCVLGDPIGWAAGRLRGALVAKGAICEVVQSPDQAAGSAFSVLVASPASDLARSFPQGGGLASPESIRLTPGRLIGAPAIWVSAIGQRGFVYGLLELAERVQFSSDLPTGLHLAAAIEEHPANQVRSVSRLFCSEIEDKPW